MYNSKMPSPDELPTSGQLIRSTLIALLAAVVILVAIVLPAEYGIDPTRIGRVLGLAEMGEIKQELAREAAEDHDAGTPAANPDDRSGLMDRVFGFLVGTAHAQEAWRDEVSFTLAPGETAEYKLAMDEGATAEYRMVVEGGRVNFDLHAHGGGDSITYERGRGSTGGEGSFDAAFDGDHGWFFRNRDSQPLTVTLQLRGDYAELKGGQ